MERLPREEHFHATPPAALRAGRAIHTTRRCELTFNMWRFSPLSCLEFLKKSAVAAQLAAPAMRRTGLSADAARARQLAQVLDARRAAFDKRCTDVTQKWKTAATEVPSEDDDIIALPPLPPLADEFSLKELFKEPIVTPAFTERQLTSATSPTSLNQLAPSPADDGECRP